MRCWGPFIVWIYILLSKQSLISNRYGIGFLYLQLFIDHLLYRLMSLLGRTLPCLHTLDISNSVVTDRGLRLLADAVCPVSTVSIQPSPSVIRNLSSLLDRPVSSSAPTTSKDEFSTSYIWRMKTGKLRVIFQSWCYKKLYYNKMIGWPHFWPQWPKEVKIES